MKKRLLAIALAFALTLGSAFALTACNLGNSGSGWFATAKTAFKNGRFAPAMRDILPESMLGGNASAAATAAHDGAQARVKPLSVSFTAAETDETLPFSELGGLWCDGDDTGYNDAFGRIIAMREHMEDIKSGVVADFESKNLTEKGVWRNGLMYEEKANGDKIIYSNYSADSMGAKLSLYGDGAAGTYRFQLNSDGKFFSREYSYLKNNTFVYMHEYPGSSLQYMSFDTENGVKKGTLVTFTDLTGRGREEIGIFITAFEGDDENTVIHHFTEIITDTDHVLNQTARATFDGIPYGDYTLDLRYFTNVEEIYYFTDEKGENLITGIKLAGGETIENPGFFMYEALKLTETGVVGEWELVPAGRYIVQAGMTYEPGAAFSGFIRPEFSDLQLMDGFDDMFADLQDESEGYFDDFYVTGLDQLALVQVSLENRMEFIAAAGVVFLAQHDGF